MKKRLLNLKTHSPDETIAVACGFAESLRAGDLIALFGELGAGKTCFVKGLAKGLGIDSKVKSPTFNIINEYPGHPALIHIDFYRLEGDTNIANTGWYDYFNTDSIIAIEWPEKVLSELPENRINIEIRISNKNTREIEIYTDVNTRNR